MNVHEDVVVSNENKRTQNKEEEDHHDVNIHMRKREKIRI